MVLNKKRDVKGLYLYRLINYILVFLSLKALLIKSVDSSVHTHIQPL